MLYFIAGLLSPYNIMGGSGVLTALGVYLFNLSEAGYKRKTAAALAAMLLFSLALGVFVANMGNWVIHNLLSRPLLERMGRAGFSGYPGLIGSVLFFVLMARLFFRGDEGVVNAAVPGFAIAHGFARIGCAFGGCCFGVEADIHLLGFHFDRVPTQIIEAVFVVSLFLVLQFAVKRRRLAVYMLAYAVFRFVIEFFRGDDRGILIRGVPLSPGQQIAALCAVVTVAIWVARCARERKMTGEVRP